MKTLAALVMLGTSLSAAAISKTEQQCLAFAIYHEARGEGVKGWKMVADVVYNRSKNAKFPKNLCSVIRQRGQFTFNHRKRVRDYAVYTKIARLVASHDWLGASQGAMWYHARSVRPRWRGMVRVAMSGHHVFYRRRV